MTALIVMAAALNCHEQVALVLLKGQGGRLMIASQNGHEQVVRVLLEAGADGNPNSTCGVMCCASVEM